jgi:hypothetical protein
MDIIGGSVGFGDGSSGGIGDTDPGGFACANEAAQSPQNAEPSGFRLPHCLHAGIEVTLTSCRAIIRANAGIAI